ncbi:hypothetical protein ACJRO7_014667 [Eucalyptus globulus]|uniref:TIR domain-containing protein n=1 Tax=Eucalyptus globulus TaxID=34317 RepID=A0ABD3L0Y2_EUCGL
MQETKAVQGYDYEVFLSFRGLDTCTGITDFLYTSLTDAGVRTYRDDEELRIGEDIGPELLNAIDQSKISIPIFSKNYASSKWCLKELVRMVECKKKKGQIIMPIFYYVEPSEVRNQTGSYGEAFLGHENMKQVDNQTIQVWKAALSEAGALKGWNGTNRHEGQLLKHVVTMVLNELKPYLVVSDFYVAVDDSVKEVLRMIGTDNDDVKILGMHGRGGIGKTTLAKVVYNKLCPDFASHCFLANVKENSRSKGIVYLQNRLLSDLSKRAHPSINSMDEGIRVIEERLWRKKVLVLLDDVDDQSQLTALLGRGGYFGPGNRILITTKYNFNGLDPDRSLQLFSKHAFKRDHPPIEKLEQSREIAEIAHGLPLLLEVMGSTLSLCGQRKEMWDDYMVKWKEDHIERIGSKKIFLDIACLFDGFDKSTVIYMWRDYGLCPIESLEVLQSMSLIKIGEDSKLWMHDQVKDLGREIVSRESEGKLDKQGRLWNHKDALDILLSEKRNGKLEALYLNFEDWSEYRFTLKGFAALPNLRFIRVDSDYKAVRRFLSQAILRYNLTMPCVNSSTNENQLLPNLRWLSWPNFPWQVLKIRDFSLRNLVILDFSRRDITDDWDGWRHIKRAEKLKVLNLSRCEHLTRTPNFSGFLMLERLNLEECKRLAEIDSSIGQLKCLVFLNLNFCRDLHYLPLELGELPALTELLLDGTSIQEIPASWGMENLTNPDVQISPSAKVGDLLNRLTSLSKLSLDETLITHLPDYIGALTNLRRLSLNGCFQIQRLPRSIIELRSLTELDLLETGIKKFPDSLESLKNLKELKLSWLNWSEDISPPKLPTSLTSLAILCPMLLPVPDLSSLINLKVLLLLVGRFSDSFEFAQMLDPMPWWIGGLSKLEVLTLSIPHWTNLSPDFGWLPHLRSLHLYRCHALGCIPQIPSSVSKLHLVDCPSLTTLDISNLKDLSELYVLATPLEDLFGRELLDNLLACKIEKTKNRHRWTSENNFLRIVFERHGLTKLSALML